MASNRENSRVSGHQSRGIGWTIRILVLFVLCMTGCAMGPYCETGRIAPVSLVNGQQANLCGPNRMVEGEEICCETMALPTLHSVVGPLRNAKNRTEAWMWDCRDRYCNWKQRQVDRCDRVKGWYYTKREEANAPPWPKFHPIPVGPAFERQGEEDDAAPEVFGTFGKQ